MHELYFVCNDIDEFVSALKKKDVECTPVENQRWGLLTRVLLPGGGKAGLVADTLQEHSPRFAIDVGEGFEFAYGARERQPEIVAGYRAIAPPFDILQPMIEADAFYRVYRVIENERCSRFEGNIDGQGPHQKPSWNTRVTARFTKPSGRGSVFQLDVA